MLTFVLAGLYLLLRKKKKNNHIQIIRTINVSFTNLVTNLRDSMNYLMEIRKKKSVTPKLKSFSHYMILFILGGKESIWTIIET